MQRLVWSHQVIEGLRFLHRHEVIHCDLRPANILVDDAKTLRLIDFGGSSLQGCKPLVAEADRYFIPRTDWDAEFGENTDRFALGSCIYFIMRSRPIFDDLRPHGDNEEIEARFCSRAYPADLHSMELDWVVEKCWNQVYTTTQEPYDEAFKIVDAAHRTFMENKATDSVGC